MLSLLYGPTLTSVGDSWKNHSFDYTNLCQQNGVLLANSIFTFQTLNPIGLSVVSSSVLFQIQQNWYFPAVVLEETLENLFDSKEIKPVNPKWNQPWLFIGRADAEAEAPILWPLDAKSQLIGKDWCWERLKAGGEGNDRGLDGLWDHQFNEHEFEQILGDRGGQRSLASCSPWVAKS